MAQRYLMNHIHALEHTSDSSTVIDEKDGAFYM